MTICRLIAIALLPFLAAPHAVHAQNAAPAPQAAYDESRPTERVFAPMSKEPVPEQSVEERLAKEIRFDPDAWIVETEDRAGRHFLEL
ncbi:hypothetical protein KXW36_000524, partial [Aspergillus fumigatus]